MFRYSTQSAKMSSGVWMARSSVGVSRKPSSMSTPQRTRVERKVVLTAVFIRSQDLAPKSRDTTTEQPMLHPKAKARKTSVTS